MLTINWQHLGAENKIDSEVIYEISTHRAIDYDDAGLPTRIEILTFGFGSLCITPHVSLRQRIFVMNDSGKTIATYEVPIAPAANGE